MDTAQAAAIVIARARSAYGRGAAPFDYMISVRGIGGPLGELGNEVYILANEGLDRSVPADQRNANGAELWLALAPELDAYAKRCKARKFTGWSNASGGPVRYAN